MKPAPWSGHRAPTGCHAEFAIFLAVVAVGTFLRCDRIAAQIVADDEFHSLQAMLAGSPRYIATHFFLYSNSTPQTLLQMAIGRSVGISELTLRLPMLAAGVASLVLLPLWARRLVGSRAALVFATLLAISPQLVYFSRFGRSYMIVTLLVFAAFYAFTRWSRDGGRAHAAAFVACGALAIWFHLFAAPTLAAPFLAGAVDAMRAPNRRERWARLARLFGLGVALLAALALLAGPALLDFDSRLRSKIGEGHPDRRMLMRGALLLAGTRHAWLAALFWTGVVAGVGVGLSRHQKLSTLLLAALLLQPLAICFISPTQIEIGQVFARYNAWVLPFALLFLALALGALGDLSVGITGKAFSRHAGLVLCAALLALGPLPRIESHRYDNFTNHAELQHRYTEPAPLPDSEIAPFYRMLASEPGEFSIVEVPWVSAWLRNRFRRYQLVHHREVLIGFVRPSRSPASVDEWPFGGFFRFRRFVDLGDAQTLASFAQRGVRYVVVHKDLNAEMRHDPFPPSVLPELEPLLERLHSQFGAPVYEDAALSVFRSIENASEPSVESVPPSS